MIFITLISFILPLTVVSCGPNNTNEAITDKADEGVDKAITVMSELADVYDKIAKGSLEGEAAAIQLKEVGSKVKKFLSFAENSDVKVSDIKMKEMYKKMQPATDRMNTSLEKLQLTGKLTPKLQAALAEGFNH